MFYIWFEGMIRNKNKMNVRLIRLWVTEWPGLGLGSISMELQYKIIFQGNTTNYILLLYEELTKCVVITTCEMNQHKISCKKTKLIYIQAEAHLFNWWILQNLFCEYFLRSITNATIWTCHFILHRAKYAICILIFALQIKCMYYIQQYVIWHLFFG